MSAQRTGEDPRETHVPEVTRGEHFEEKGEVTNVKSKERKPRKNLYIYIYIFTVLIEARVWTSDSEVVGIVSPSR